MPPAVFDGGSPQCNRCNTRRAVQPGSTTSGLIATEVNGFVSWIASFAVSLCFLVWAVVPHEYLHRLSISYLLNTYWALAIPVLALIGLAITFFMYNALNLLNVRPLDSFCLVSDDLAPPSCPDYVEELRAAAALASATANSDASWWMYGIPLPREGVSFSLVQDLPLPFVNRIMFRVSGLAEGDTLPHFSNPRLSE